MKERCQNTFEKNIEKKPLKNRFLPPFGPPKTYQNRPKLEKNRKKNTSKNKTIFGRQKNCIFRPQEQSSPNFCAGWAVRAGPGEGIKGWGKAQGAGIWALHLQQAL